MTIIRSATCIGLWLCTSAAHAADYRPSLIAHGAHDWRGRYFGAFTGYGFGTTVETGNRPSHKHSGQTGGAYVGYNWQASSPWVAGIEADLTFPNYLDSNHRLSSRIANAVDQQEQWDYVGSVRGRLGYASGNWLAYATGGFAYMGARFVAFADQPNESKALHLRTGWVAGAGLEYAMSHHWRTRIEYLYHNFGNAEVRLPGQQPYEASTDFHSIRIGLTRRIDNTLWDERANRSKDEPARWEIHGQMTYVGQGHGQFRAPYAGQNSLSASPDFKSTWSGGLHLGVRLWDGGELYFNPELAQGYGFNNTVGLAGFSNGEAQKSNFAYPHFNPTRLFLRQTFGLGGEQESLEAAPGQLSGKVDVSRITVQFGKFAVTDIFDDNAYAKDTRRDFLNWSIWAPGAFDYAADRVGFTYGATVTLNQRDWAIRAGYFLIGSEPNANHFDMRIGQRGTYAAEYERRYKLFDQPGAFRVMGWINSANAGSFSEALTNLATGLDIESTRRGRMKYGYVFNVEQALADDFGLFGRWSWNDGKTESVAFTDITSSLSFGASIKGNRWSRPDDVIGIGFAFNSLSDLNRRFIAAGGMGLLIGDGRLSYRQERVFEAYYAFALTKQTVLTADYQLISNPAYNADRGPVSIFTGRLHTEF